MKSTKGLIAAILALTLALTACGRQPEPTAAGSGGIQQKPQAQTQTRTVVVGLDRTGSYALEEVGRRQMGQMVLSAARPGDVWYFRWIDEKSYDDSAILFTLRLPQMPPAPTNPFDRRARVAQQARVAAVDRLKRQIAQRLIALKPSSAPRTDIWGFLAKAQELLGRAADERLIVIASDLEDNVRRRVSLELKDVRVLALAFQGGSDPGGAARRKAAWKESLKRAGVAEVRFLDPSESLEEALSQ